jgi:predicted  nucleic acid-binding Zn-ribbon protein
VRPDIQSLLDLQAVDLRLAELRSRLASFPQQVAAVDARIAHARQQLAAAKDAQTTSLKDRKKYELDVESWKERARKYRDQSFAVKTNEAYKALQNEIQHAESEMARAEDRLLEKMVAGEEFERQIKAAERNLMQVEQSAAIERQRLESDQAELQRELETKTAERQQQVASVPDEMLNRYEHVGRRHHGVAVAQVRDEACSLCGVRVRPHVFQELRRQADAVFQCESCSRILYYIEPPAPPSPPEEPSKTNVAGAHTRND